MDDEFLCNGSSGYFSAYNVGAVGQACSRLAAASGSVEDAEVGEVFASGNPAVFDADVKVRTAVSNVPDAVVRIVEGTLVEGLT